MKIILVPLTFFIFFLFTKPIIAQVGIGTTTPLQGTSLQIDGDNSGILINRVSLLGTDDTTTIPSLNLTQEGLLIFNTNTVSAGNNSVYPGFYYWNGTIWQTIQQNSPKKTGWVALSDSNTSITINGISTSQASNPSNYTDIPINFTDNPSDNIIDTYAPEGYTGLDFFDSTTNRITALSLGDAINLRLQFNAIPTANNSFLVIAIDIGITSPIIIFQKTIPLLRGSNEINRVSESILLYQLATFVANGARLKIAYSTTSGSPGTVNLSNFGLVIERLSSD